MILRKMSNAITEPFREMIMYRRKIVPKHHYINPKEFPYSICCSCNCCHSFNIQIYNIKIGTP